MDGRRRPDVSEKWEPVFRKRTCANARIPGASCAREFTLAEIRPNIPAKSGDERMRGMQRGIERRAFLALSAAAAVSAALPQQARAAVPKPYSWDAAPPMTDAGSFIKWMQEHRGEDPRYL